MPSSSSKITPVVLVVLDGWGVAPPSRGNALTLAKTPTFDSLVVSYPVRTLQASGIAVGLPWGEMGNSEVGHMNLGLGRVIYQDLPRITEAIWQGSFFKNKAFLQACQHTRERNSSLHLLGLVSSGGVHSYIEHLYALLELAQREKINRVFIQAILDGRDTSYRSGLNFILRLKERLEKLKIGKIATLSGRFYALDRDNHWDRTEKAYLAMTQGKSKRSFSSAEEAIQDSYNRKIFDEELEPLVLTEKGKPRALIKDGDAVIFFNFRSDRARQLTKAFVLPSFEKFRREKYLRNLFFVTMTEYDPDLPVQVAFPSKVMKNSLAEVVSKAGFYQLHIAETEKYAHVSYFFNGGREPPFRGEKHILIPSVSIASYDQKPEMSAREIKECVLKEIAQGKYSFVLVNFANPDMVAHTGNLEATCKAIETLDFCLKEIVELVLSIFGVVIITSDHGNAEEVVDLETGEIDKEHNTNPVPFILVGKEWEVRSKKLDKLEEKIDLSRLVPSGVLADVAPTILKIIGLPKSKEMTGRSLI